MKIKCLLLSCFVFCTINMFSQKTNPWYVDVSTGYQFYTKGGEGLFAVNIGIQKQISQHFSLGLTTGGLILELADPIIPVLADARFILPIDNSPIDLIGIIRGGLYIDTDDSGSGIMKNFGFQVLPGIQFHASQRFDVRFNVGYEKIFMTKSGDDFDMIPLHVGVAYKF